MRAAAFALMFVSALARAEVHRIKWRGVATGGSTAPARIEELTLAQLALTLRHLGIVLGKEDADAEGGASCTFNGGKSAQCIVEVVRPDHRGERRQEIPFRDAEDLARSLALLTSDLLQSDFPGLVTVERMPGLPDDDLQPELPPPPAPPAPPPTPPAPPPTPPKPPRSVVVKKPYKPLGPSHFTVELGPSAVVGFTGEPPLWGAHLRVLWSSGPLRTGGTLAASGTGTTAGPYSLTFTRFVLGPRVGAGFSRGRIDLDLTVGPALYVLGTDAHIVDGQHTTVTFAGMAGSRLLVRLVPGLALHVGADFTVAAHELRVTAGTDLLASFGLGAAEITVGLAYHR